MGQRTRRGFRQRLLYLGLVKSENMGRRDKGKKKAVCQGSDVFTMFEKGQLQEFKEAFEMIDSNRDGFIDKNDLKSTYMSLGVRNVEDADNGKIHSGELIEALTCEASRFSKEEIDALMDFAPVDVSGYLDYKALCYIITHGQEEE